MYPCQLSLFAEDSDDPVEKEAIARATENLRMAEAQYGNLIGRPASWMRLYTIENPPKRATVFCERRNCGGTIVAVSGGAYEYSPRLIIADSEGLQWWIPPTAADYRENIA